MSKINTTKNCFKTQLLDAIQNLNRPISTFELKTIASKIIGKNFKYCPFDYWIFMASHTLTPKTWAMPNYYEHLCEECSGFLVIPTNNDARFLYWNTSKYPKMDEHSKAWRVFNY